METMHLLDIPEILTIAVSFIPVWEGSPDELTFIPRDLLSSTLVSKLWRQVSLPFLWKVYSAKHMTKIPIAVLSQNSIHFHHFYQDNTDPPIAPQLWSKDASGQPVLKCSSLESFSLTRYSLRRQLEHLRTNRGLVSLEWWHFESRSFLEILDRADKSFAASVKDLHFHSGICCLPGTLVSILHNFTSVEHLHIDAPYYGSFPIPSIDWTGYAGVNIHTLKKLTLSLYQHNDNSTLMPEIMSIFHFCSQIEHLVLHKYGVSYGRDYVTRVLRDVLAWRSRIHVSSGAAVDTLPGTVMKAATPPSTRETHHSLDKLDLYLHEPHFSKPCCLVQFQRSCQDLVVLKSNLYFCGPRALVPLTRSFKHTLREVELEIRLSTQSTSLLYMFGLTLGTLKELRHFAFVAADGMTKEESFAVFQGRFPVGPAEDPALASSSDAHIAKEWACRRLESLTIRGLWRTQSQDKPDKGENAISLQAASEGHQWVALGPTRLGKRFMATISGRIQTLPELRQLTLDNTTFAYSEIHAQTA